MACKTGYTGPICAVCEDGYFKSVRDCVPCEEPRFGALFCFILAFIVFACVCLLILRKYRRYLKRVSAFSHLKILVSFLTIVLTMETQFEVPVSRCSISVPVSRL
jgi:hypothetical protein